MKKNYLLFIFLISTVLSHAQQTGMYSHYYFKPMIYNPAYTGVDEGVNAMMIYRNQWRGFRGAPQLNIFSLDGNIVKKAGVGMQLISDRKGLSNRIGGNVSYAYRLMLGDDMHLALGISLGIMDQTIDFSKALLENNTDPVLFNTAEHTTTIDGNAGLAFKWKTLDVGLAVPQFIGNRVNYVDNADVRSYYTQTRHYMGSIKYKIPVLNDKGISVTPLVLVRFLPNVPLQYDGTLNVDWQNKLWIGATYKSNYAVGMHAGICIHKQLSVGYSYDFIIGKIGSYSGMCHEIMINFKFGTNKKSEPVIVQQLPPVVPTVQEDKNKILENKAYENRMDSLQRQLKESQENLRKLSEKLDEQLKSQSQKQTNDNRNSEAIETNVNKTMVEGVWVITNKTNEFKDDQNHEPEKGFYVIVGTFIYRDLAIAETQRFIDRGFKTTNWVYYELKKYNYVFMDRSLNRDVALKRAKEMRESGIKDVWIQELIKDEKGK
jgi:type IX secretion system PorP/SprF family membrane protein